MAATVYLKTDCEQCGNPIEYASELAGQSIECPHCQQLTELPSPFVPPPPQVPPVIPTQRKAGDEVFFDERGILVSRTRFVAHSQTFALANITSVKGTVTEPSYGLPAFLFLIAVIVFFYNWMIGVVVVGAGIAFMAALKPTYSVVLTTAGGEVKAFSTEDQGFASRVLDSLTKAIVARG